MAAYKDSQKKALLWKDKAEAMGKTVIVLLTWYKSIRSRYGRILKKKSGDGAAELTERDLWVKAKFEFLKIHIHDVQKRTLASLTSKIAASAPPPVELSDDAADDDDSSVQPSQRATTTPTPSVIVKSRAKSRKSLEDEALLAAIGERSSRSLQIQEKLVAMMKPPDLPSERQAFADWTQFVMIELDHDVWRRFQQEMSALIYKFLDENDLRRRQMPAPPPVNPQPGPSRQHYSPSVMWQPQPGSWPTPPQPQVSVWQSQSAEWMQQQQPHLTQLQPPPRSTQSTVPFHGRPSPTTVQTGVTSPLAVAAVAAVAANILPPVTVQAPGDLIQSLVSMPFMSPVRTSLLDTLAGGEIHNKET